MRRNSRLLAGVLIIALSACGSASENFTDSLEAHQACAPQATTRIAVAANLSSRSRGLGEWDIGEPSLATELGLGFITYTVSGEALWVDFYFTFVADRTWDCHVVTSLDGVERGHHRLSFDPDGALIAVEALKSTKLPLDGGSVVPVTVDFGTPKDCIHHYNGLDGITSTEEQTDYFSLDQDGRALSDEDCNR